MVDLRPAGGQVIRRGLGGRGHELETGGVREKASRAAEQAKEVKRSSTRASGLGQAQARWRRRQVFARPPSHTLQSSLPSII